MFNLFIVNHNPYLYYRILPFLSSIVFHRTSNVFQQNTKTLPFSDSASLQFTQFSIPCQFKRKIAKFRYPAKVSQTRYGIIRYPAFLEISENPFVQRYTRYQRSTSHANANRYQPALKKNTGHRKFTASCTPYRNSALFLFSVFGEIATR